MYISKDLSERFAARPSYYKSKGREIESLQQKQQAQQNLRKALEDANNVRESIKPKGYDYISSPSLKKPEPEMPSIQGKTPSELRQILHETDVKRVKLGAQAATPKLSSWLEEARQVKTDNDLMARGQFPIYSKPSIQQLQNMHKINMDTRAKLDPDSDYKSLEISLRADELGDRQRILNGELPTHRTATKKELDYVSKVINGRVIKTASMADHVSGDMNLIRGVENDLNMESNMNDYFKAKGVTDDRRWNEMFGTEAPKPPCTW
jgi:hypothetical protein